MLHQKGNKISYPVSNPFHIKFQLSQSKLITNSYCYLTWAKANYTLKINKQTKKIQSTGKSELLLVYSSSIPEHTVDFQCRCSSIITG